MTTRVLSRADETPPLRLPEDPRWLDTYCFEGYDPSNEIFFHLHSSTWQQDRSLWRELVLISLGGGRYAVHEGYGRASAGRTFGSMIQLDCIEPGRTWRLGYTGPAQLVTGTDLSEPDGLRAGPSHHVELACTYEATLPVWSLHGTQQSENYELGASHYEQPGTIRGSVRLAGTSSELAGYGYRDKSRGARSLDGLRGYCWLHGRLDDGVEFGVLATRAESSNTTTLASPAAVWVGGELHDAVCIDPPLIESATSLPSNFTIRLAYGEQVLEIEATASPPIPYSFSTRNDWYLGRADRHASFATFVESLRLTSGPIRGVGMSERSSAI